MNYLRNLKSIHMKDVKLPKESLNYLEKVYDACDDFLINNTGKSINSYSSMNDILDCITRLSDVKPVYIPMYEGIILQMIAGEHDIMDLYEYAKTRYHYLTEDDMFNLLKISVPDSTIRKRFIHDMVATHPDHRIAELEKDTSYFNIVWLFLAIVVEYPHVVSAIDILTRGKITKSLASIATYMANAHDIFRYIHLYSVDKEDTEAILTRARKVCKDYRDLMISDVLHGIEVIAFHSDLDPIPESIEPEEICKTMVDLAEYKNTQSAFSKTMRNGYVGHPYTEKEPCSYQIRTGTNPPLTKYMPTAVIKRVTKICDFVKRVLDAGGYFEYHSLYELMRAVSEVTILRVNRNQGTAYLAIPVNEPSTPYELERFQRPQFKLIRKVVKRKIQTIDVAVKNVVKKEPVSAPAPKKIPETKPAPVKKPPVPEPKVEPEETKPECLESTSVEIPEDVFIDNSLDINTAMNAIIPAIRRYRPMQIAMDPKSVYVDGKEYKFKNDPLSNIPELLEPPTHEWYHMTLDAIADRADRSCGIQSMSYFPTDEFGEPDRSDWEPRRNNWNQ